MILRAVLERVDLQEGIVESEADIKAALKLYKSNSLAITCNIALIILSNFLQIILVYVIFVLFMRIICVLV